MKLIEGMKTLKLLEKRMQMNAEKIIQYASVLSSERPLFGTEEEQRKQVRSLVQANTDLAKEYLILKRRIDQTNISTIVRIGVNQYSILDMLVLRRKVGSLMKWTYSALNDSYSQQRMTSLPRLRATETGEKPPRIERMYSEQEKNEGLAKWQDLLDEIETRIEVINATTELLD